METPSYPFMWSLTGSSGLMSALVVYRPTLWSLLVLEMLSSGKFEIPKEMLGSPSITPVSYAELSEQTGLASALLSL